MMTWEGYTKWRTSYLLKGDNMNLKLFVGKTPVEVTKTTFPGGESCIRISGNPLEGCDQTSLAGLITMDFKNNGDLVDLMMLVDAVRRYYYTPVELSLRMDYLPYARQDRVCNPGESLSVKVVTDFINSMNFARVYCKDIHSNVGEVLINNLIHIKLPACANDMRNFCKPENTTIVSPDAGAEKKVFDFAKQLGYTSVVRASKVRNVSTGKIERTTLIDDVHYLRNDYLIVDDICDGGRTFIELAKVLKANSGPESKINLYVTHGIFSAGLQVFEGFIDKIYVNNLMNDSLKDDKLITVVN